MVQAVLYKHVFILKEQCNELWKEGTALGSKEKSKAAVAAQGNLQVHMEDSFVLHSSQHGEPRAGGSLKKN